MDQQPQSWLNTAEFHHPQRSIGELLNDVMNVAVRFARAVDLQPEDVNDIEDLENAKEYLIYEAAVEIMEARMNIAELVGQEDTVDWNLQPHPSRDLEQVRQARRERIRRTRNSVPATTRQKASSATNASGCSCGC